MRDAFKDDAVCGEKESSLCWQDVRAPQQAPSGLLPAVRIQKHPEPLRHQLLSRKQHWTQNFRLTGRYIKNKSYDVYAQTLSVYEPIWALNVWHWQSSSQSKWLSENMCVSESDLKKPGNQLIIIMSNDSTAWHACHHQKHTSIQRIS